MKAVYDHHRYVSPIFDQWAYSGRAVETAARHQYAFNGFLKQIQFNRAASILELGCGNGWATRIMQEQWWCERAVAIDISNLMIEQAKLLNESKTTQFICSDIVEFDPKQKFDFIFSMECLYYLDNPLIGLEKAHSWLNDKGCFVFATDCFAENKECHEWDKYVGCKIHVYSKQEWLRLFMRAGFSAVTHLSIKTEHGNPDWNDEQETFFIIAYK